MALFCVFDGHAGKECSTALLKEFPSVFKKHWNATWEGKTDLTDLWKAVYQETDNNLKKYEYEGTTSIPTPLRENVTVDRSNINHCPHMAMLC